MTHYRIKQYELKVTRSGRKLILWKPLERGGRAVAASAEYPGDPTVSTLMAHPEVAAAIPKRLRPPQTPPTLANIP